MAGADEYCDGVNFNNAVEYNMALDLLNGCPRLAVTPEVQGGQTFLETVIGEVGWSGMKVPCGGSVGDGGRSVIVGVVGAGGGQ
ncbi:hypothetical protein RIF29_08559 [Crotalaria pallida]|uniref:Uncharacterized protein n=1 Tax=Crotalaria pallida TaxID=3830 RepID=A0AAN9FXF9_CROPI